MLAVLACITTTVDNDEVDRLVIDVAGTKSRLWPLGFSISDISLCCSEDATCNASSYQHSCAHSFGPHGDGCTPFLILCNFLVFQLVFLLLITFFLLNFFPIGLAKYHFWSGFFNLLVGIGVR